jgi:alpha-2-macroglobulin
MADERAARKPAGSLEILLASPRGDVDALHSIDLVFSEAMVPLGARGEGPLGTIPLVLEPPIDGSFTWIGTRALSFVPRDAVRPGTRITCRVPRGTRSPGGSATTTDYAWEIVVARPKLVASVPAEGQAVAAGDTLYMLFNIPPAARGDSLRLAGPGGDIPLARVAPDSAAWRSLDPDRAYSPSHMLALRPEKPMTGGGRYTIEIAGNLRFEGTDVKLQEPRSIDFETYGPPRPLTVAADDFGIAIDLAGPVDPESLRAYMTITPSIGAYEVIPQSGTSFRLHDGKIRGGSTYTFRFRKGLPSLLGARLERDETARASTPHREPALRIDPSRGYIPLEKGIAIRIAACNVDTVTITGRWLSPDEVLRAIDRPYDPDLPDRMPRVGRWREPRATPESTRVAQIPLERFGPRPGSSRALAIRVRGRRLFATADGSRPVLSDMGFVQVTDLGLSAIAGPAGGIAWATRLSTGEPIEGATIALHAAGDTMRDLWSGTTDGDGLVRLPPVDPHSIREGSEPIAEIRTAGDAAWLRMPTGAGWGPGSGETTIYTFTDRPLYRPGETVHWLAIARRATRKGLAPSDVPAAFWRLQGPDGRRLADGRMAFASPGQGSADFKLPPNAPVGGYQLTYGSSADEKVTPLGWAAFQVEEYRLPRFQARLDLPAGPVLSGTTIAASARFSYLNGGPLAGMPVVWTISRQYEWSRPEKYSDHSFDDPRAEGDDPGHGYGPVRIAQGEGVLDRDGMIRIPITPDLTGLGGDRRYAIEIGARDLTDRSAYVTGSFVAFRAAARVGVRARPSASAAPESAQAVNFSAVCLDSAGQPASGIPLNWKIEKRSWKTVRIRRIGGVFGYENVPQDSLVLEGDLVSSPDPFVIRWTAPSAGIFSFVVEGRDPAGRTTRAREDAYVAGEETAAWARDDHGWLDLKADRTAYDRGDTARILIPAPAVPTEGLFVVLDPEAGIRSVRRLPRLTGSPAIPVPLTDALPWGMWCNTILVGAPLVPQGEGRLPYHGWGNVYLRIRPEEWKLNVQVATDRPEYRPGDPVTVMITIRDSRGRPLSGTAALAVVDDAIFELAGPDSPDPLTTFYAERGPGAQYADVRWDLKRTARGEKGEVSPGGDGHGAAAGLRRRFTPTVHWDPSIPIGTDGRASVTFRLADDLTRYRYRVVATSGVDRFGYGDTTAPVVKPLQIEFAVPRFAREGDKIEVASIVRGDFKKKIDVRISAEAFGARLEGKKEQKVTVRPGENGRAVFRLGGIEPQGVRLVLRAAGAGESDAVEVTIPYDRPLLFDREFTSGLAQPSFAESIVTEGAALPDTGGLRVVAGPSMLSGLDAAFAYGIEYPYGCVEQLSSVLLTLAAQRAAERHLGYPVGPTADERQRRFDAAIAQISRAVEPWALHAWPTADSETASDYTAGYALYAAVRARQAGYAVPAAIERDLAGEAERRLRQALERGPEPIAMDAAWLIFALSESDRAHPADSSRVRTADTDALFARPGSLSIESRIVLALSARERPEKAAPILREIRDRHLMRTGRHVWVHTTTPGWGDGYGGDPAGDQARVTALWLDLLREVAPDDPDIPAILRWLLDGREPATGAWRNDHVTALALDAAVGAASRIEGPLTEVAGTLSIGDDRRPFRFVPGPAGGDSGSGGGMRPFETYIPWSGLARRGTLPLRVEASGDRPVYVTATLDRARPAIDSPPREEGLIISRSYVDPRGIDMRDRLPLGDPLFVHLAIVVSRDARMLVIEDPLPGGCEAVNTRFRNAPGIEPASGDQGQPELAITLSEIRDRAVRLFAENVPAGIYHIYYPAIATTAGMYRTPGPRAEFLYSSEIYGTGEPRTLTVERRDR